MTFIVVQCPHCHSKQVVKRGKTRRGSQRYWCQNTVCATERFLLVYRNRGCLPEVKQTIIDMSLNASGIRDTARVLRISTDTVLSELKKKEAALESVNSALLRTINSEEMTVDIERAGEAEVDEMWGFVGKKGNQRWLWHAIDHATGAVLAYVFGRRKDDVFLKLKALLEPFGLTRFYTDHWGAYTRHLDGRRYQLGEGGHSSENAVFFWNPHNTFQKEMSSQCYASRTAYAMTTRLCNGCATHSKPPEPCQPWSSPPGN